MTAEHLQKLDQIISDLRDDNQRLRAALQLYANGRTDGGDIARRALRGEPFMPPAAKAPLPSRVPLRQPTMVALTELVHGNTDEAVDVLDCFANQAQLRAVINESTVAALQDAPQVQTMLGQYAEACQNTYIKRNVEADLRAATHGEEVGA